MSSPFSGLKNKPSQIPAWKPCLTHDFTLISFLNYFPTLEMEATCSSETSVDFQQTTRHYRQNTSLHSDGISVVDFSLKTAWYSLRNICCPPPDRTEWIVNQKSTKLSSSTKRAASTASGMHYLNRNTIVCVAARSKAWTVFASSKAGIVGSNPTQTYWYLCVRLFCVCVVLCVDSGLATSWSPVQGVLPSV
jgi:hypothetical protein